jgi:hypothetical protein
MDISSNHPELQVAAERHVLRARLRTGGIASIAFGALALGGGAAMLTDSPLNSLLFVIGALLVAEGIWLLASPSPAGLIVDGIAVMVIGVWNLAVSIAELCVSGVGLTSLFAVVGACQIVWGIQSLCRYRRFAAADGAAADPQFARWAAQTLGRLSAAKPARNRDVVQLAAGLKFWKGLLLGDGVVFVAQGGADVAIAPKDQVDLEASEPHGKYVRARLRLGERVLSGQMLPGHVQRLEVWQAAPAVAEADADADAGTAPGGAAAPAGQAALSAYQPPPPQRAYIFVPCACGQRWQFEARHAGQQTQCPACGRTIFVTPDGQPSRDRQPQMV